jgi:hypothetical protein
MNPEYYHQTFINSTATGKAMDNAICDFTYSHGMAQLYQIEQQHKDTKDSAVFS